MKAGNKCIDVFLGALRELHEGHPPTLTLPRRQNTTSPPFPLVGAQRPVPSHEGRGAVGA